MNRITRHYLIQTFLTISLLGMYFPEHFTISSLALAQERLEREDQTSSLPQSIIPQSPLFQSALPQSSISEAPIPQPSPSLEQKENSLYEGLLPIEAITYEVKVLQKSKSNRIYLLEYRGEKAPQIGRMLLLKKEESPPTLGLSLLKVDTEQKRLVAKAVKKYPNTNPLEINDHLTCIEKVSDLAPPLIPTEEDNKEILEMETSQNSPLPVSPPPTIDNSELEEDIANIGEDMTVADSKPIDLYQNWLSLGFGLVNNSHYFTAGNVRYGINLTKRIFFERPYLEDSLTLEAGTYFYKTLNFTTSGDAYTVTTLAVNGRYNLWLSESFGIFVYFGMRKGIVLSSILPTSATLANFSSVSPLAGGGLFFQIGPNWYTRIDVGIDAMTLNLLLRF